MKKLLLILSIVLGLNFAQADDRDNFNENTPSDKVKSILLLMTDILTVHIDEQRMDTEERITVSLYEGEGLGFSFDIDSLVKVSPEDCDTFISDMEPIKSSVSIVLSEQAEVIGLTYQEIKDIEDSLVMEVNMYYQGDVITCRN